MKELVFLKPRCQHLMLLLIGLLFSLNATGSNCRWRIQVIGMDGLPLRMMEFKQSPVVTFSDNQLILSNESGENFSFDLSEVRKITYVNTTGIEDITIDNTSMKYIDDNIEFSALKAGTNISVYAANGMLMMKKLVVADGDYTLPLSNLSKGVYMINVNGKTHKIVKK